MIKRISILAFAGIFTLNAFSNPITIPLFNGSDFNGLLRFLPDSNADLDATWKIKEGGVLWCSGDPAGYIRTEMKYANYKLRVQWRWPGEDGNNGVLVHVQEKDEVWPKSFEMQMHSGNAGDIWVIGGANFKEHTNLIDRRVPMRHQSSEMPLGSWNQFEIICQGDRIEVYTNGVLQNVATECTLTEGYIALQSEGTPIEYREILLTPLEEQTTNENE